MNSLQAQISQFHLKQVYIYTTCIKTTLYFGNLKVIFSILFPNSINEKSITFTACSISRSPCNC